MIIDATNENRYTYRSSNLTKVREENGCEQGDMSERWSVRDTDRFCSTKELMGCRPIRRLQTHRPDAMKRCPIRRLLDV